MKKIVDSSAYSSPSLREYLAASTNNIAVLTDYVAMEAYNGKDLQAIFRAAEILGEYPSQVLVLRSTKAVCGLSGRRAGLVRRMIDESQTKEFQKYCLQVASAKRGDGALIRQLLLNKMDAQLHLDRMLRDANELSASLSDVASTFSAVELKTIRKEEPFGQEMKEKMTHRILELTALLHRNHPTVHKLPTVEEVTNTFLFRVAVCAYALAIDWARVGGSSEAKLERVRNDAVDVSFSAYATYFDGLLSDDKKQRRIYVEAQVIMESLFGVKMSKR